MFKMLAMVFLAVAIVGCEREVKVVKKCYIQIETDTIAVPDTVYVANPDTTWLNDSVFVITVLSRDTVTRHVDVDTSYSRSSEPRASIRFYSDTLRVWGR